MKTKTEKLEVYSMIFTFLIMASTIAHVFYLNDHQLNMTLIETRIHFYAFASQLVLMVLGVSMMVIFSLKVKREHYENAIIRLTHQL